MAAQCWECRKPQGSSKRCGSCKSFRASEDLRRRQELPVGGLSCPDDCPVVEESPFDRAPNPPPQEKLRTIADGGTVKRSDNAHGTGGGRRIIRNVGGL